MNEGDAMTTNTYGVLSCFGCGRTGPYKMVDGHPYCKLCRDEHVPEDYARMREALPLPVRTPRERYTGPTVPVEWGDLPAFVRWRWVEGPMRDEKAVPDWSSKVVSEGFERGTIRDGKFVPDADWSELQDPRD